MSQKWESRRHPLFYYPDGSAIFSLKITPQQVDANESVILYKLHSDLLKSRSTFFHEMFSLPRGPGTSTQILTEGSSDDNPIQLPENFVNQFDFDNLLTYLFRGPVEHPNTVDFFVSVLRLSTFYQIQDGRAHAIAQLEGFYTQFHPALKLQLARFYNVERWIEPAFRKLLEMPIDSLDLTRMEQIGPYGFFHLVQTKEKLLTVRRHLAFHVPPITGDPNCDTPGHCGYAWTSEWQQNVPRRLHHPEQPCDSATLLHELERADIKDLCKPCQKLSVSWVWGKQWTRKEEDVIQDGIAAVKGLQTSGPMQATMKEVQRRF